MSITPPRLNGSGEFVASWIEASPDPAEDGAMVKIGHERLGFLMGYLEAPRGPVRPIGRVRSG